MGFAEEGPKAVQKAVGRCGRTTKDGAVTRRKRAYQTQENRGYERRPLPVEGHKAAWANPTGAPADEPDWNASPSEAEAGTENGGEGLECNRKVSSMANQALNSSTTSSLIHMYTVSLMEKWDGFKNGRDLADAEEIKKRWKKYTGRTG